VTVVMTTLITYLFSYKYFFMINKLSSADSKT